MKCRHFIYDPFGFKWSAIPFKHILYEMCPGEDMDCDAEQLLYEMASDFTKMVLTGAAKLAKNRNCGTLELDDFILYLKMFCDIQPICFSGNQHYINKHPCKHELATLPLPKRKYTRRSVLPASSSNSENCDISSDLKTSVCRDFKYFSSDIEQTTTIKNGSKKNRQEMQRYSKNKSKHSLQNVNSPSSKLSNPLLQCSKRRKVSESSPTAISMMSVEQHVHTENSTKDVITTKKDSKKKKGGQKHSKDETDHSLQNVHNVVRNP